MHLYDEYSRQAAPRAGSAASAGSVEVCMVCGGRGLAARLIHPSTDDRKPAENPDPPQKALIELSSIFRSPRP